MLSREEKRELKSLKRLKAGGGAIGKADKRRLKQLRRQKKAPADEARAAGASSSLPAGAASASSSSPAGAVSAAASVVQREKAAPRGGDRFLVDRASGAVLPASHGLALTQSAADAFIGGGGSGRGGANPRGAGGSAAAGALAAANLKQPAAAAGARGQRACKLCGGKGHYAKKCPVPKAELERRAAAALAAKAAARAAALAALAAVGAPAGATQRSWREGLRTSSAAGDVSGVKTHVKGEASGRFTAAEIETLDSAVRKYVQANTGPHAELDVYGTLFGKGDEQQHKVGSNNTSHKDAWLSIGACLPQRSLRAQYEFAKRRYSPHHKSAAAPQKWKEAETASLRQLVQQNGRKWSAISEELGRNPDDLRTKFDDLPFAGQKRGSWSSEEDQRLKAAVAAPSDASFSAGEPRSWKQASKAVKTRGAEQCAKRWKELQRAAAGHTAQRGRPTYTQAHPAAGQAGGAAGSKADALIAGFLGDDSDEEPQERQEQGGSVVAAAAGRGTGWGRGQQAARQHRQQTAAQAAAASSSAGGGASAGADAGASKREHKSQHKSKHKSKHKQTRGKKVEDRPASTRAI